MADRDVKGEMLIAREERKLERAKAKLEALAENMTKTIAAQLKQEAVKKALAKEAMDATKHPERRERILDIAGSGIYDSDREVVTGREPRPWEEN